MSKVIFIDVTPDAATVTAEPDTVAIAARPRPATDGHDMVIAADGTVTFACPGLDPECEWFSPCECDEAEAAGERGDDEFEAHGERHICGENAYIVPTGECFIRNLSYAAPTHAARLANEVDSAPGTYPLVCHDDYGAVLAAKRDAP